MTKFKTYKVLPGDSRFQLFNDFPKKIYEENSQRFKLGNDPVKTFLEGRYILEKDGEIVGRFSLYENPEMKYNNFPVCCLGSYECIDDLLTSEKLLSFAVERAKSLKHSYLIGPMEGSTWNNYRFSDHNDFPNFFMEPFHQDYYPQQFIEFGFKPVEEYLSNIDKQLNFDQAKIERFEKHYIKKGAIFRNFKSDEMRSELAKIARFSNAAFKDNFLFTPISEEDFIAKYLPLTSFFIPELIWIVEDEDGEMQALSFSINDYNNSQEKSLILKSLARKADSPFKGVGAYLAAKTCQLAKDSGYESIIHALMKKNQASIEISKHYGIEKYKSYTLYGIEL